ncbi:uncharacterized protein LOC129275977 [Lytechinus pictus]|uniref:uncharacterized protein LOC129275977 n=1 Tax=Lytechinus pictus TaxID=7653 RepID=UPI0030BA0523
MFPIMVVRLACHLVILIYFQHALCECLFSTPLPPANGDVTIDNYSNSAHFTCEKGYYINGNASIECIDGQWSESTPICKRDIGHIVLPVGISVGGLILLLFISYLITILTRRLRRKRREQALQKRLDRLWSTNKDQLLVISH